MVNLPIAEGSAPAIDLQVNNPRLQNAFVNPKQQIQLLPTVDLLSGLPNTRAVLKSTFNERFVLVTNSQVFFLENEALVLVGNITFTFNPIRLVENRQNQVTIVNGVGAWVWEQSNNAFIKLDVSNGFDLTNPTDVTILDTFTIIVSSKDKKFAVSDANNATSYSGTEAVETDNRMGELIGCAVLNNNLMIFGQGGVQRWLPSIERTPFDFPFTQDPSYRDEYGCVGTGSILSDKNELYYLTEDGQVRLITPNGSAIITNDGISNIINQYADQERAQSSYFYHKGHYLYQLTFPDTEIGWVYCFTSKKWSESTTLLLGYDEEPILSDGLYQFSANYSNVYFEVIIQTPYMRLSAPNLMNRSILSQVILEITQGKGINNSVQLCDLQLSKDNVRYGNRVRRFLSAVGKRLFQFRWFLNYTNTDFTCRFILQLKQDIVIEKAFFRVIKE